MKKVMFIGQAMPRVKRDPHDWPSLNSWLYSIGIKRSYIEKSFLYSALVDYFPGSIKGSHIVPTKEEIEKEKKRLHTTIKDFNPEVVVPIGKLSISYCLNEKVTHLSKVVGKSYTVDPYTALGKQVLVIPFPHPSGASTWRHNPENKVLLQKALTLIKHSLK